jgi:hypothetical protein
MLNVLNLITARQTIMYNTLLTIFKIKNKIVPQYLYSKIKFISERQNYNLRNCRDFDIKFSRYDIKYKSIYYEGLRMYNKLPRKIKNCTIMLKFKQL